MSLADAAYKAKYFDITAVARTNAQTIAVKDWQRVSSSKPSLRKPVLRKEAEVSHLPSEAVISFSMFGKSQLCTVVSSNSFGKIFI